MSWGGVGPSVQWYIDEEDMDCTMEYYSDFWVVEFCYNKDVFFVITWMDLKGLLLREVKQKETKIMNDLYVVYRTQD